MKEKDRRGRKGPREGKRDRERERDGRERRSAAVAWNVAPGLNEFH